MKKRGGSGGLLRKLPDTTNAKLKGAINHMGNIFDIQFLGQFKPASQNQTSRSIPHSWKLPKWQQLNC